MQTGETDTQLSAYAREQLLKEAWEKARVRLGQQSYDWRVWPDPVEWIESHFYVEDSKSLFELAPPQAWALREALRRDEQGYFVYTTVLWSWIKKSAKSTIIAAVVDYVATHRPRAKIKLIANDLKQADSRVGFYLRENIKLGEVYGIEGRAEIEISPSNYKIVYPNGSIVEMIPIDPRGEAGGNDDLIVFSELWGWKNESHQRMWAEMTPPPSKYGHSQRWIDTYAGYEGESPILEELFANNVKEEYRCHPQWEFYANARGRVFATWVTKPLMPKFQPKEYYDEQRAILTDAQFNRMHRNQWATSTEAFLPDIVWYDRCGKDQRERQLNAYTEVVVGIDAATTSDGFAVVMVGRDPFAEKLEDGTTVDATWVYYAKVWYPEKRTMVDVWQEPKAVLRGLAQQYNVIQFAYDPWQMEHMATELRHAGLGWFDPFHQGSERAEGDKMLYDMIRERRARHAGSMPALRTHVKNANRKQTDRGLRIVKRNEADKIDLVVAWAMANKRALDWIPKVE